MKIIQAFGDDWDTIRTLLQEAALPIDDLGPADLPKFLIGRSDVTGHDIAGAIALEQFGTVGLLRSLVVGADARHSGMGGLLVHALEAMAAKSAIAQLYLITIDADGFFAPLGYAEIKRTEVPESIRATKEFSELCPDDAIVMTKVLPAGG